ncbi:2,3-bisphosphoglycerate-independent phosphoglycerate mutase [Labilibaculum antarcticum]|uniref:2,3-bisphosphoglycerate-independent phosphoglycerate mutase n=1 Tax=Labilibaculum antarcticum TaxID=1717717 RepID=A0A1Y1CJE0_9BACT|nr:2,3-bisphosphoglycerate-independent phosphoglycerate mutase [Labilibaculum antarcticum]BAX80487.1 phosphoglycerate mutase (2,3-diphosphoglycerate-independent) [Labilibaculum antarcticum]
MTNNKKALLMILDGWGIGDKSKSDVISSVATPYMDSLLAKYPNSQLQAAGRFVGLPDGQMGNSEVGHLNIGAGRVVYQDLVKINIAVEEGTIKANEQVVKAFTHAKENGKKVHLIGLIGNGGVHALSAHAIALCDAAQAFGLKDVFVHGLTDGRDTDPKSGLGFVKEFVEAIETTGSAKFASLIGRYYGMDRDSNWERVKLAYDLYTKGEGVSATSAVTAMEESYAAGVTDEFIKPIVMVDEAGAPLATIEKGDVVICFNFRTDRLRQLTTVFTQEDKREFGMHTIDVEWYTMTCYNANFKGVNIIYNKDNVKNTMGEVVAKAGRKQIRIAETEKYAHVTFFFSGGREAEFEGERRLMVPSPKVATYDLQPEMSAPAVADMITAELNAQSADFVCLNFANGDMVGHTGVYEAISKAVQAVDKCAEQVVEAAKANGYDVIIIADHGNADFAVNADGSPNTAHSLNPVPCIWVTDSSKGIENGILADVSPTLLDIMGIEKPEDMTGKSLIK